MSAVIKNTSSLKIDDETMVGILQDWLMPYNAQFKGSRIADVTQLDGGDYLIDIEPDPTTKEKDQ